LYRYKPQVVRGNSPPSRCQPVTFARFQQVTFACWDIMIKCQNHLHISVRWLLHFAVFDTWFLRIIHSLPQHVWVYFSCNLVTVLTMSILWNKTRNSNACNLCYMFLPDFFSILLYVHGANLYELVLCTWFLES